MYVKRMSSFIISLNIFIILTTVGFIGCEVPPHYPSAGFRPNPPFNLPSRVTSQPQTIYGPPNATPSKLALVPSPQIQYGAPNTQNVQSLGFGTNSVPNVSPNFTPRPTILSTSYGVPITDSSRQHQDNVRIINSQPQTAYGAPNTFNNNLNRPQTQYGAPDTRNIESLEQIRQLNLLLQLRQSSKLASQNQLGINLAQSQNSNRNIIPTEQYLPIKDAANFRGDFSQFQNSNKNVQQPLQQYLPSRQTANFRKEPQLQVNIAQRQIQTAPTNNFGLSPNKPNPSFQPTNRNIGDPILQYQPSQFHVPQRQIEINSGNKPGPSFQLTNQNNAIPTKYQPSQLNRFSSNVQNRNNVGGLSQQYVPSIQNSNFQESERKPNNFGGINQNIPQSVNQRQPININANVPLFSNGNPNNFERDNGQNNFDIQQANVRTLPQIQRNKSNAVPTQPEFARPVLRPAVPNQSFGRPNPQDTQKVAEDETYLPPTSTARTVHRQLNRPGVTLRPTEAPDQQDEQSPETEEEAGSPNISIANAVVGAPGEQSFYLLQPDGRLQRVTYQKTREEGAQENEYTANYLFQNIQADPALVYSPLITLTK